MKSTGIWLDSKTAYIITIDEQGYRNTQVVLSKIEDFRPHGGSGTRFKGGPQDVVQDSKYLERRNHQFKTYFKNITKYLSDSDSILIFGPAMTGHSFAKELEEKYRSLFLKVKEVKKADSMSKNQLKAYVLDYYNIKPSSRV
ncbi:MAG: hypothetical protein HKN48_10985 [Flavobacteriaceae bacterium]|nr:hypothetical protein [Flavobacteriaceae bacterium]